MLRISKNVIGLMLAAAAVQQAGAFSLWGPLETWQTPALDYTNRTFFYGEVELGGTKNFGEGSRINVPVLTYGFDATFLDYFGEQGVHAVDTAIAVFNALPPASGASANLREFITQGNQQINYTAQALGLIDIKSEVMGVIMEHLGLIGESHVWDLRARDAITGGACQFAYGVILRNFDPITYDPSSYVNGQNYTYYIGDACPIGTQVGDAFELPADATTAAFNYTAVATKEGLNYGGFYLGITRDDFGGLRYLYRKNQYAYEALDAEAVATASLTGATGGGGGPFAPYNPITTNTTGTTGTGTTVTPTAVPFVGVLGGVEKVQFVKVAYNPVVGALFTPVFYTYTVPSVTAQGQLTSLSVTRTLTQPDILFTAADLVVATPPIFADPAYLRGPLVTGNTFVPNNVVSAGGGLLPSVMNPTLLVTLNKVGVLYYNFNPAYLDLGTGIQLFNWGSFDGTTNAPILYPTGYSLGLLEEEVLSGGASAPSGAFNPVIVATNGVTNVAVPLQY